MLNRDCVVKVYDALISNCYEFDKACEKVKENKGDTASTLKFLHFFSEISSKSNELLNDEKVVAGLKQQDRDLSGLIDQLILIYDKANTAHSYYQTFQNEIKQNGKKSAIEKLIPEAKLSEFLKSMEGIKTVFSLYYSGPIYKALAEMKEGQVEVIMDQPKLCVGAPPPASSEVKNSILLRQPSTLTNVSLFNPTTHQPQYYPRECAGKPIDVANMPKRNETWSQWISNNKTTIALGGICIAGGGYAIYFVWSSGATTVLVSSAQSTAIKLGLMAKSHVAKEGLFKGALATALAASGSKKTESASAEKTTTSKPESEKNEDPIRGPHLYY